MFTGEQMNPLGLNGIGVLIFVHQHILEPLLIQIADVFRGLEKLQRVKQQVVEVHHVELFFALHVMVVELQHVGDVDRRLAEPVVGQLVKRFL